MKTDPRKILLVEDNPGDARLLREILAESGGADFELEHVETLAQAWEALETGDMTLILLDLSVPDSQGVDTFTRTFERHPEAPIVVLTGLQDEDLALQLVQKGAQDYLVKGEIDSQLLVRSLRYAIERARMQQALSRQVQQAQASEARFRQLADATFEGIAISENGILLDANERFARMFGYEAEEAAGRPVIDFVAPESQDLVRRNIEKGYDQPYEHVGLKKNGSRIFLEVRGVTRDEGKGRKRITALRDITRRKRRERERVALQDVREAVWQMQCSDDFQQVLTVMREGLVALEIPFQDWGINIIDSSSDPPRVMFHNMSREGGLRTGEQKEKGRDNIVAFWGKGEPVYRRDLTAEDRYQEREYVGSGYGHAARSVLDIPFSHGTLALNSEDPDAFSPQDIAVARELAEVLFEGIQRREDLCRLEEKNQLLEAFQEIGQLTLSSLDIDSILVDLTEAVMRFGIFRSLMIALVDPRTRSVEVVQSGINIQGDLKWDPGQVVGLRYGLDDANITAQVARTGEPAVIEEWDDRLDPRVDTPERRRGKVAYFIPVRRAGQVLAVLATGSEREDKQRILLRIETMQPLLDQVAVALEHARLYRESIQTLQEREALLREIHHRVKNNLQIIASLLRLTSRNIDDPALQEIFGQSQDRIHSMALVHETLYSSGDLARVNFKEYLRKLTADLLNSYRIGTSGVVCRTHIDETPLEIHKAVPCGLLVSELITNALKHAFPDGRQGEICVDFRRRNGQFVLRVADDGIGLPEGSEDGQDGAFGMRLVRILTRQLDGQLCVRADCGTTVEIVFPA